MKRRPENRSRNRRSPRSRRWTHADPRARLWRSLKNRRLGGYKFRRRHRVGEHTFDFYCPDVRLGIEVVPDGKVSRLPIDDGRSEFMSRHRVIWYELDERRIVEDLEEVQTVIWALCGWRERIAACPECKACREAGETEVVMVF